MSSLSNYKINRFNSEYFLWLLVSSGWSTQNVNRKDSAGGLHTLKKFFRMLAYHQSKVVTMHVFNCIPFIVELTTFQEFHVQIFCESLAYHIISLMSRMFTSGLRDRGSIPGRVIPKSQKMVLDAVLLNTQHNKVRIKGKVEQSREWSSSLPYTVGW